jgi:hypothetical protein
LGWRKTCHRFSFFVFFQQSDGIKNGTLCKQKC